MFVVFLAKRKNRLLFIFNKLHRVTSQKNLLTLNDRFYCMSVKLFSLQKNDFWVRVLGRAKIIFLNGGQENVCVFLSF